MDKIFIDVWSEGSIVAHLVYETGSDLVKIVDSIKEDMGRDVVITLSHPRCVGR